MDFRRVKYKSSFSNRPRTLVMVDNLFVDPAEIAAVHDDTGEQERHSDGANALNPPDNLPNEVLEHEEMAQDFLPLSHLVLRSGEKFVVIGDALEIWRKREQAIRRQREATR